MEEDATIGKCRKALPMVDTQFIRETDQAWGTWPITEDHDWCGEHRAIITNHTFSEID